MIRVYTYEEVEEFFDQDTYGNLLDLLRALINNTYTLDSLRSDIGEYTEDVEKSKDIAYD